MSGQRTIFEKGAGSTGLEGAFGASFAFGSMRNTAKQRESKGTPIYFHERPTNRPYGNDLGVKLLREERQQGFYRSTEKNKDKNPERLALKKFSWEQPNA